MLTMKIKLFSEAVEKQEMNLCKSVIRKKIDGIFN